MDWVSTVVGIGVVVIVLRDVFHTLLHPAGRGTLARLVMRLVWRSTGRGGRTGRISGLAGPLGMAAVAVIWGAATTLAWALIYLPHMPEGFSFSSGVQPHERNDLLDSVYLSLVTVATLGFGDIVPTSGWLRLVAPVEAVVGFSLLTAVVSWILEVYPALTRRRILALRLALLRRARNHPEDEPPEHLPPDLLADLAAAVAGVRVDLTQFPASYYFREQSQETALPAMLGYALGLVDRASESADPQVRVAGRMLSCALDDLATVLDDDFLRVGGDTRALLRAYARDQRHHAETAWAGQAGS
ncbi:potassium channel family protein [Micromonospora phytophila]|uniref:potassium channel family protein n=1 Tax=Micromonospora phytophila TaxID=709888 RepID=UPI00202E959C|nr:potassium channel family protein [Micromonospora phytophila]MCM0675557.1 potassium channel family protein [Micromonospora phytophila]